MLISGNRGPLALSLTASHTKLVGDQTSLSEKYGRRSPRLGVCGLAPVVQRADNFIRRVSRFPTIKCIDMKYILTDG